MTERATVVYGRARVVGEALGRKPPNKVRTGGENEGDGGVMPVVSHTPPFFC